VQKREANLVSFIMHFHFWLPSTGTWPAQTNVQGQADGQADGRTEKRTAGQTDSRTNGQPDGQWSSRVAGKTAGMMASQPQALQQRNWVPQLACIGGIP